MALLPDRLSSGPLDLERWRPDMVDEMVAAAEASRDELLRWMPWAKVPPSREGNLVVFSNGSELFDSDQEWNYALVEKSTGDVVGSAGLHRVSDPDCPEIGYWVRSDRTGRGYATAAARALVDAAFRFVPEVPWVRIRMDQANLASAAIPPKLGFRLLRVEDREIETEGHTGKGYVWVLDRPT
jgi:RimJ/RimL family protein N-acetyltransferase